MVKVTLYPNCKKYIKVVFKMAIFLCFYCDVTGILHSDWPSELGLRGLLIGSYRGCPHSTGLVTLCFSRYATKNHM